MTPVSLGGLRACQTEHDARRRRYEAAKKAAKRADKDKRAEVPPPPHPTPPAQPPAAPCDAFGVFGTTLPANRPWRFLSDLPQKWRRYHQPNAS
jgi:hypothetical protein